MYMQLTDSVEELITLDEIKEFTRVNSAMTVDDGLLMALLDSAITYCEKYTGISIASKDYERVYERNSRDLREFACELLELRKGKITNVESVIINDDEAEIVDITDIVIKNYKQSTKIYIPDANLRLGTSPIEPLVVTFTAGFTALTLPPTLKTGILQLLAYWYENRETAQIKDETIVAEMPLGTTAILNIYRLVRL